MHAQGIVYSMLLQALPESLVLTLAVFSILRLPLWDRRVLHVTILQTLTNLIQLLPIAFGMHSVLLLIALAVYTRLITKMGLSRIFLAILMCFAVTAIVDLSYSAPLLKLTDLTYETVFADPCLRAAFALPDEIAVLSLALGMNWYNHKKGLIIK